LFANPGQKNPDVKVIGLTGGIGMGKSTCAQLVQDRGIPVVDTDDLARQVVEPGEPALAEVAGTFGPGMLDAEGRLRRDELAGRVFADPNARRQLEQILHPRIRELWRRRVADWTAQGHACGFVVIPLLFETQAEQELDATICVACSAATQWERLAPRGWTREQAERRVAAQLPIESKLQRANYVIWSEGGLAVHAAQLDRILAACRAQ
jgi:dephospho-CoA kinase